MSFVERIGSSQIFLIFNLNYQGNRFLRPGNFYIQRTKINPAESLFFSMKHKLAEYIAAYIQGIPNRRLAGLI